MESAAWYQETICPQPFSTCNSKICILRLSLPGSFEQLAATDLCLSRTRKKLGHYCDPQGPFGISTIFVGTLTPHKAPQKAQGRQLIVQPGKKNPTGGFEVLWPVSKQHWRKEGNSEKLSRLSCTSEIFHCTFCVFSFLKQAGLESLMSVTYGGCTTLPVCVGINTLNTLTAVMCSFQGKIPAGHETEMGRLWRNMVYRELPSHVLWESSSSASQGWHGTSVFTWLHYWALKVTMLVCIQTHSQGQSSFLIFLPWMCIPFWTFLLKLQWTGSFTKEDTKYLNSTNHRSELPHRQGQFTHCPGISNCPSIK